MPESQPINAAISKKVQGDWTVYMSLNIKCAYIKTPGTALTRLEPSAGLEMLSTARLRVHHTSESPLP